MKKPIVKNALYVRAKVLLILGSCKTLGQLNACDVWFRRIAKASGDELIFTNGFHELFNTQYLSVRKRIMKTQGQEDDKTRLHELSRTMLSKNDRYNKSEERGLYRDV